MTAFRVVLQRIRGLFTSFRDEQALDAELRSHIDALTEANLQRGMAPADARQAAHREFGGVEQAKEAYRDQRSIPFFDALRQDLRFAFRMLANKPAFTAVAILTLAVGIGATSAVFSVVDRILFRSLPYSHDEQLVSFGLLAPIEPNEFMLGASYVDFRRAPGPFQSIAAMATGIHDCDINEQHPVRLACAAVEQSFLPTLGVEPLIGRNFTLQEDRQSAPRVALLSFGVWQRRFGADPQIIGKTLLVEGAETRIIGVLPSIFAMPTLVPTDILVPLSLDENAERRTAPGSVLVVFARMKAGINVAQAIAQLQPFFEQAVNGAPPEFRKEIHLSVRSLREKQIHDVRLASWLLLGSVLAVLLIACTNTANLLLSRSVARLREIAVRTALGASRGRLLRQALTESLLLAGLGSAVGVCLAGGLLRWFISIAPTGIPYLAHARLDARILSFTVIVGISSALLFGIAPGLVSAQPETLVGRSIAGTGRSLARQSLVASQIAVSLVLLAGAMLLLRSLWSLQNTATGIEASSVLTESITLGAYGYPQRAQQSAFFQQLLTRMRRLPGVTALALSDSLPPSGPVRSTILAAVEVAGQPSSVVGTGGTVVWRAVSPDYFRVLSIAILSGRPFDQADLSPWENSIILSESLAHTLFPSGDALNKKIRLFREQGPWRTVVGIAADVKNSGLIDRSGPEFYLPWKDDRVENLSSAHVIVRTSLPTKLVANLMREETATLDSTLPFTIDTMSSRVHELTQRPRFNAVLLALFASMGVLLASIGIYGVVAFLVQQQTREIGVRMALGATPQGILNMILSGVARWTISGALLGLIGAWLSARFLESLLFQVRAHDPVLLVLALAVLLTVAFLAAIIPARRAMRVDPMVALRYE